MFPLNGSVTRRSRFPPPDPAGFGSPASSVLSRRSDARRPSRSAPFRSPSGTSDCCNSRGGGELPFAGSSSVPMPVPQSSAFDSHSWRRAGSPRFLGNPSPEHALLFDPGGPDTSGHCDAPDIAFRSLDGVGSTISHISRLYHTACSLAVYASRLGLLRFEHRARLASR